MFYRPAEESGKERYGRIDRDGILERAVSSVGRTRDLHSRGRRFEPCTAHQEAFKILGDVV